MYIEGAIPMEKDLVIFFNFMREQIVPLKLNKIRASHKINTVVNKKIRRKN